MATKELGPKKHGNDFGKWIAHRLVRLASLMRAFGRRYLQQQQTAIVFILVSLLFPLKLDGCAIGMAPK